MCDLYREPTGGRLRVDSTKADGHACMPPNFLGFDDSSRLDCVSWIEAPARTFVRYDSGRVDDGSAGKIVAEWAVD